MNVIVGYQDPPFNTIPIFATYECAPAAEAQADNCVDVGPPSETTGTAGTIYNNNYLTAFPSGLTIGIVGTTTNDATWSGNATPGRANLKTYLSSSPGDQTAPGCGHSQSHDHGAGGILARRTATLALNIGFNALAGVNGAKHNFGSLTLCNLVAGSTIGSFTLTAAQATALNGKTISQVLADANNVLGGNAVPAAYGSAGNLNEVVNQLNLSFDSCSVSAFATSYLCPICP